MPVTAVPAPQHSLCDRSFIATDFPKSNTSDKVLIQGFLFFQDCFQSVSDFKKFQYRALLKLS